MGGVRRPNQLSQVPDEPRYILPRHTCTKQARREDMNLFIRKKMGFTAQAGETAIWKSAVRAVIFALSVKLGKGNIKADTGKLYTKNER